MPQKQLFKRYSSEAASGIDQFSSTKWHVGASSKGLSFADHLASQLLVSPAEASDLIDFGSVYINGRVERNPQRNLAGDEGIEVHWPRHGVRRFYEIDPDRVIFRDGFLLAYDKESGTPSQQVPADAYNNLFAALYRYLHKQTQDPYAALHHRLDRETSGVMLFATDRSVNRKLGKQFQDRAVKKEYVAWVKGCPDRDSWTSIEDIGRQSGRYVALPRGRGKSAETDFKVLLRERDRSLLWACPKTGRTHQIRLHAAAGGYPVIGDRLYGTRTGERLYLHAYRLSLTHPASGTQLVLTAPIPAEWPHSNSLKMPEPETD